MSVRSRALNVAWIVVAVIGGGAIATAVGVRIYQYRFEGRTKDGAYLFTTEGETITQTYQDANGATKSFSVGGSSMVTIGSDDPTGNPDNARKDLEEIQALRDQDARELISVTDSEVNGEFHRACLFKYTLSDGRTISMGESEPGAIRITTPDQVRMDAEEIEGLRQLGQRELVGIIDTEVEGQVHRTCQFKYVLSDGRTETVGESDPELPQPARRLTLEQHQEMWRLRSLGEGEFLGILDRQAHGKTFACETHRFTLSDGTVVTLARGEVKGRKTSLTKGDWDELHALQTAGSGEDLGTEEKEVMGRTFVFTRKRYVLSDGTQVIYALGQPKAQ